MMPGLAVFVADRLVHLSPVDIVIVVFYFALVLFVPILLLAAGVLQGWEIFVQRKTNGIP